MNFENHEQQGTKETPQGNYLSRQVFGSPDLASLKDTYGIDRQIQRWDVTVPFLGDRPVMDDTLVNGGQTTKKRGMLGLQCAPDGSIVVNLSEIRASRTDATPQTLQPPLIGGVATGVFSAESASEPLVQLQAILESNGNISVFGERVDGQAVGVFSANDPRNTDYERFINFFKRMLAVPQSEGVNRTPRNN